MRDISGADFKFAKTLTLDFFGSGMVHLPPGGAKRVKNSRKMQMVFFVFYGRVTVNIGTPATKFSIGKGGQWQVPRGELQPCFTVILYRGSQQCISHVVLSPRSILSRRLGDRTYHRSPLRSRIHILKLSIMNLNTDLGTL